MIKPARDFDAYHRALRERGLVSRLGEPQPPAAGRAPDDLEQAVTRIRRLLAARSGEAAALSEMPYAEHR